jgi:molybdopterin molybdotransferase
MAEKSGNRGTAGRRLIDDCFVHDKDRLRHDDALALIRARLGPVKDVESVRLEDAAGRILAEPVVSSLTVPPNDNAAVDGYAIRHADYTQTGGWFAVGERIAAGHLPSGALQPGSAARIFTGAMMPEGADSVAMQEDCETHEQDGKPFVVIPPGLKAGANRRKAGEDLAKGDPIAGRGQSLRAQDVAAIASTGLAEVTAFQRLKVALVSTGDEIIRPGQAAESGQSYDSNHFLLRALLQPLGAEITDLGVLADDAELIGATLADAAKSHDAVITTGGASRGEEDHLLDSLDRLGRRHMWQLAVKPGRPMMFGQIGDCAFLGLPGNPVAAFVCFLLYARPVLLTLGGGNWPEPQRFAVPAAFKLANKKPDRREFLRGRLDRKGGILRAAKFERDGSGLITSLREADGLIELDEECRRISIGDSVTFIPFSQFGLGA